ncbi:MAG: DUF3833 family protein [Pseudomonadota bacterium]
MRHLFLIVTACFLTACKAVPNFEQPSLGGPKLDLEQYFVGDLRAYGQFQDITGKVRDRFTVDLEGRFDGEVLTLVEDFVYDDGREEQRIWRLTKTGDYTWDGRADGVFGVAKGVEDQDRFNFQYTIALPNGDGTSTTVQFDDWLWRFDEKRVLNKAYVSRYGIRVGVVTIWFEKI